jgi:uncharacterized membrane protein
MPARASRSSGADAANPRIPLLDVLRGVAVLAMFAYHFAFDLNHFGVIRQDFNHDRFWLTARSLILGSFLFLSGVSLALATSGGIRWSRYLRRIATIGACAALVSAGSYLMFPKSWIWFGVLHCIAIAGLLMPLFLPLGRWLLPVGLAIVAAGAFVAHPLFDSPALQWLGLMTRKPMAEDYVPLLPWFGVVLVGVFAGWRIPMHFGHAERSGTGHRLRLLEAAGRHSLLLYLLHQPVFLGVLSVATGSRP